jgi:hypothetical protein
VASKKKPAQRPAPKAKAPARPVAKKPAASKPPMKKSAPATPAPKAAAKPAAKSSKKSGSAAEEITAIPLRGDGRRHMLSLSFLRDGDEFMARLETDVGQITELKNRSLDQLLTLVAGELEDLLE